MVGGEDPQRDRPDPRPAAQDHQQEVADDPYAQKVFDELLRQASAEAEARFDHPLKQYALFKDFEDQLAARQRPGVPTALDQNPHALAYFASYLL